MAKTNTSLFHIYLKDFRKNVEDLGEVMKLPLTVSTRFGMTGDYMEKNPYADSAEKCFYLEIMMLEKHCLFRAFTQQFGDAEKIHFIDGVKKALFKAGIQMIAKQHLMILTHEQSNKAPELDLESPAGYPKGPVDVQGKTSEPEEQG